MFLEMNEEVELVMLLEFAAIYSHDLRKTQTKYETRWPAPSQSKSALTSAVPAPPPAPTSSKPSKTKLSRT